MVSRFLAAALVPRPDVDSGRPARVLTRLVLLLHFAAAIALGVQSVRNPVGNWDMIPYTALAHTASGLSPQEVLERTYYDLRQYLGPVKHKELLGHEVGPDEEYRATIAHSPAALTENLRFYSVKPLYIAFTRAAAAVSGNAAQAGVLVSAAAFSLFIMVFPLFFRWRIAAAAATWVLAMPGTLEVPPLATIAACGTPDSLGLLFAGTAALVAFRGAAPAVVAALGFLAVLARPDTIFLLGPLLLGLAWLRRREAAGRWTLAVLALLCVTFVYLGTQALPWGTLFRHTFFGRIAYPLAGVPPVTPGEYWAVVSGNFPEAANLRVAAILLGGCALAALPWLRSRTFGAVQLLAASAVANVVLHFLVFPIDEIGHERLFLSSYFLILAALVFTFERRPLREGQAA